MARTHFSRFLRNMKETEAELTGLFALLGREIRGILSAKAEPSGVIPVERLDQVLREVNRAVDAKFIQPASDGHLTPFEVSPATGQVLPNSPYSVVLFRAIERATRLGVEQHAQIMRRFLQGEPEVLRALTRATENPFVQVREQAQELEPDDVFKLNPLATYDPAHRWVDPSGYRLSDRVWRVDQETRRKIDGVVSAGVFEGVNAVDLADELEKFLQPGRQAKTTLTPYGREGSYDARRLARTEITRAHAGASEMSAMMNPFVQGIQVVLSTSHPKPDICDEAAAAGPWPKDEIPERFRIPLHPHCLCHYNYVLAESPETTIAAIKKDLARAKQEAADKVGPLTVDIFTRHLLGMNPVPFQSGSVPPLPRVDVLPAPVQRKQPPLAAIQPKTEVTPLRENVQEAILAEETRTARFLREQGRVYHPETGELVWFKQGTRHSVRPTIQQKRQARDMIFTHNHPTGEEQRTHFAFSSFSDGDLGWASTANVREIRAVFPGDERTGAKAWIYRMQRPTGGWPRPGEVKAEVRRRWSDARKTIRAEFTAGDITLEEDILRSDEALHQAWTEATKKFGIPYTREPLTL